MCGICGYYSTSVFGFKNSIHMMNDTLINRGPDDFGIWQDYENGISLGHRRLSVLDLSNAGHQPMKSFTGRYMMVFNGEIYNHLSLRDEIEKSLGFKNWKGSSDTETLISMFDFWGIDLTLQKLNGMFAIAVWDKDEKTLTLVRDNFGEKPIYYGWQGNGKKSTP